MAHELDPLSLLGLDDNGNGLLAARPLLRFITWSSEALAVDRRVTWILDVEHRVPAHWNGQSCYPRWSASRKYTYTTA